MKLKLQAFYITLGTFTDRIIHLQCKNKTKMNPDSNDNDRSYLFIDENDESPMAYSTYTA